MVEVERKYLVQSDAYLQMATHYCRISQGYLTVCDRATVRVRIFDDQAHLTIKGRSSAGGLMRSEWEYPIPLADGRDILTECADRIVDKVRYYVPYEGFVWEVDRFAGRLKGLVLAEVELNDISEEPLRPSWLGREVTGDMRYYNAMLANPAMIPPPTR